MVNQLCTHSTVHDGKHGTEVFNNHTRIKEPNYACNVLDAGRLIHIGMQLQLENTSHTAYYNFNH